MFAQITVPVPINQLFTYLVPPKFLDQIFVGSLVYVPFGNRKVVGTVVGFKHFSELESGKIKEIKSLIHPFPVFDENLLKLTKWISDYYFCAWGEALKAASPPMVRKVDLPKVKYQKIVKLQITAEEAENFLEQLPQNYIKQILLLKKLLEHKGKLEYRHLKKWKISKSTVDSLIDKDVLFLEKKEYLRTPYSHMEVESPQKFRLTQEQEFAVKQISESLDEKAFEVFLLHGVTGSGKTQVYIDCIKRVLEQGRTAIVLVPEISLTPQTIRRFKSHFGDKIAVLHSSLSMGERFDAWRKAHEGAYKIVVGARSAIFAPVQNLGLIIIDEEHESSYKQTDSTPKYHARDVAIMRAKFGDATVVLGSATPAIESMYNAKNGKYKLLSLPERVEKRLLPEVEVVDVRDSSRGKKKSTFSQELQEKIFDRLSKKEQIILFLNKRGFSSFVQCWKCGYTIKCKNCDITLTYHRHNYMLLCHYCDFKQPAPDTCPECGSEKLMYRGFGTQKIEDELLHLYPKANILRMDMDTTRRKGSHDTILQKFGKGGADILLGTQMVAKGLDFPKVTLVGVISADISLNIPDFRSSERTFQILSQVAGRAGRGTIGGEVIVQTMLPTHYSIVYAQKHDYDSFYQFEINHRKELAYPPFTRLVRILLKGTENEEVSKISLELADIIKIKSEKIEEHYIQILGPAPAPISKIKTFYRWHLLLKALNYKVLHQLVRDSLQELEENFSISKIKIEVDVDTQDLL